VLLGAIVYNSVRRTQIGFVVICVVGQIFFMEGPVKNAVKRELKEVGSLLTAERSSWRVSVIEVLPNGKQEVTTGTGWFYEGVTLREQNGEPWIVAMGRPRPTAPAIPDGPDLLLSLINLVDQPIPWDRVDEAVSAEKARAWCRKYGLPAVENVNALDMHRPQLSLGFFRRETLTLALLLNVWVALVYQKKGELTRDLPQLWKARASQRREATDRWSEMLRSEAALMAKRSYGELVALARSGIADLLTERMAQIQMTFSWDDPSPRLRPVAPSLFHIGYMQAASLFTKPQSEIERHHTACELCRKFIWGHGNKRYCGRPCNRHMQYNRNTRGRPKACSTSDGGIR
jgi:hypothetical protein